MRIFTPLFILHRMKIISKYYPHLLAILGFILVSLIYFYPVMQGKQIYQSDIAQYTGMAKEQNDFRAQEKEEPYWTNSAFGGMPTYQLGAKYPNDAVGALDDALRFLPRPADYLFLYFLGFYGLLLVLKVDPLKAFFGAIAFGFSTYLIIILGVGHNAKAHAIAYMPLVVAGVILVFRRKYVLGGLLTMIAGALEINANHFQMTYYLLFLLLIIGIYFLYKYIKEKEYKGFLVSIGVFIVAGILAIGANATSLLATAEYADFSTRGKSELTFNPDGSKAEGNSAMTYDYITEYSYGIAESLNLIAPRLFGGSNNESIGKDSKIVQYLQTQEVAEGQYLSEAQAVEYASSGMPTYWGDQPIVAAPAYIGAIVFFLAVLALFIDNRKIKYVFLAGAVFSLFLSWGKHFSILTDFFIDFVPMYNKFRAVSSIQVLLELCLPVLAIMGLQSFFKIEKDEQWKALKKAGAIALGLIALLFVSKGMFSFTGGNDQMYAKSMGPEFLNALKEDREAMYSSDLLRSGLLILAVAGILWIYIQKKLSQTLAIVLVGILMVSDLFFIDKNYVNSEDFVAARQVKEPFQATPSDMQILQDQSHYRVFEVQGNMASARASFFHKSIGGYSAVKPRKMQQLFDYQIAKNNIGVLNMLNVKYVINTDENGQDVPIINPDANGNAWFVEEVKFVNSADEEMKALDKLDTKKIAVINKEFQALAETKSLTKDSTATIKLDAYEPNYLKYTSNNSSEGIAVFSEIYYPKGWKVTIDGKETKEFPADYALRALKVPAGKHTIEFKFEPQVVKTGSTVTLISSIVMLLLLIGGIYFESRKKKSQE